MTRSELIQKLSDRHRQLSATDIDMVAKTLLDAIGESLTLGRRVEVRGFGSFHLHGRPARMGRNPKTGERVQVPAKKVPAFKPGKELRERVDKR